jgi:[protein-PII] uridylyltransferase
MASSPLEVGAAGGFAELRAQLLGRTGIAGPARRRALARLTDSWLAGLAAEAGVNVGGVALVAVGGFGRGEHLRVGAGGLGRMQQHQIEVGER